MTTRTFPRHTRNRFAVRVVALAATVAAWTPGISAETVRPVLRDRGTLVAIHPESMKVTLTTPEGIVLPVSAEATSAAVANLAWDSRGAAWELPSLGLAVSARMESGSLLMKFVSARDGRCTWPVMAPAPELRAFVLPRFEGSLVPADDPEWIAWLEENGPLDTTADLSMPFWGVDCGPRSLTYIVTNPFNNRLSFAGVRGRLGAILAHEFTRNQPVKEYGVRVELGPAGPVEPARCYRRWLAGRNEFATMADKIRRTPEAAKLPGAAHVYLWGDALVSRHDVRDWKGLCADLQSSRPAAVRIAALMGEEPRRALAEIPALTYADAYLRSQVAEDLSRLLGRADLFPADIRSALIPEGGDPGRLPEPAAWRLNCRLLAAAFPGRFEPVERWGDGVSVRMIDKLSSAGLDRLWLGLDNQKAALRHPEAVVRARELGYLIGPYDSYESIHSPDAAPDATWETAQFDRALYETGPVVLADGTKKTGFQKRGFRLSPSAARPYVEARVNRLMAATPYNSWFMDCDAFGDLLEDYSPLHPATQEDDMNARLARMAWIRDKFGAVVGSEGGSAYAARTIFFAHGMMTPVIGWGDPDLKDRKSPHFLGGYYPPDGPAVFVKPVPLKPAYRKFFFDPRYRLPLYGAVFHDSVVATHQWGFGSLKFADQQTTVALLECLYQVPPLYHLNEREFAAHGKRIAAHYAFLSPLLRETALLPMTDFGWVTGDRLVQRAVYGGRVEVVANFGDRSFDAPGVAVPPASVAARSTPAGPWTVYTPPPPRKP